jgi:hypothetical protein
MDYVKSPTGAGEEFGWPRLPENRGGLRDLRAHDIVEGVIQTAEAFTDGAAYHDVTLFCRPDSGARLRKPPVAGGICGGGCGSIIATAISSSFRRA